MRLRRSVSYLLLAGLAVIAAVTMNGCSSGGGTNSLFPGAVAQGTFVGAGTGTGTGGAETWNVNIDHNANTFTAQDVTAGKSYSGTISTPPSGFLETVTTSSNDPAVPVNTTGHSIEIPGTAAAIHLNDGDTNVVPLVNTGGVCQTVTPSTVFNSIVTFESNFDSTTSKAYSTFTITSAGTSSSGTITGTENKFRLDGTSAGSGSINATCSNGVITDTSGGNNGNVTGFSADLFGIGAPPLNTTSNGFVAMPDPGISIATIVAGQYNGMLFRHGGSLKLVGCGPGSGSSITCGSFANIKTDLFNTHATDITINFAAGPSAGLFTGSIVDENNVTHSPIIVEVNTFKNKIVIFGLTTDTATTNTFHFFLKQQ